MGFPRRIFMNGIKARHYFNNGYMCAESVLMAVTEALDINNPAIPAIATGFCSGIARTRSVCGAFQGGVLAISLIHGRNNHEEEHDICYRLIQELNIHFMDSNKTTNCLQLTDCDLSTEKGRTKFKEEGIKEKTCLDLVEKVTDYTIKILRKEAA